MNSLLPNWEDLIDVFPLGCCREPVLLNPVLHSTFVLIKHRVIPMDLILVQTPSQKFYSFLSVTWGIVADIDFESEKYRNLGEARFTIGAIKRIVSKCHCQNKTKSKIKKEQEDAVIVWYDSVFQFFHMLYLEE